MKMRSVTQHSFARVPRAQIPRSSFDRSSTYKTTLNEGYLIPFFVDEALPGDTFNLRTTAFARMATPIFPIMDNLYLDTFFFAVPNRLVWDNWQKFCGEQVDPGDSIDYVVPTVDIGSEGGISSFSVGDYFGLPVGVTGNALLASALPFRAYLLIWNEWFRDQNLQDSQPFSRGDSAADINPNMDPLRRGKRHDYFTSCLPWPQKGDAVDIPLGQFAPVISDVNLPSPGTGIPSYDAGFSGRTMGVGSGDTVVNLTGPNAAGALAWDDPALVADLSEATAATINQLRQAFQVQRLLERDARGGTRYTEILRAHFGVISPDARLQRPEYLGGGSRPLRISPVPQTSATDTESPQGNLSAFVTGVNESGFVKSFTEHCIIIGLCSVRADLTYQQGLNRMWSRATRYDFFWPSLSHIGEQAVLKKEIFADGSANDDSVFGYQERYGEYRYKPNMITGLFRSNPTGGNPSLDAWHLSQDFDDTVALNADFIQDQPPVSRVIAVPSQPHFLLDAVHALRCARPMPLFGVPGLIDHF